MHLLLQLKLLGLCALVLAEIAASVAYVNYVVRFRSGLENNDTLRRMWSKPEQVIFRPVALPLVLSWVVGLGANALVRSIMVGFLQLIDALRVADELSLAADFAVTVSGTAAGTLVGTVLYLIDGGAAPLAYQTPGALLLALAIALPRVVLAAPATVVAMWVVAIAAIVVGINVWVHARGILPRVPTAAVRELRGGGLEALRAQPAGSRWRFIAAFMGWALLLLTLRVLDLLVVVYVERSHFEHVYLAQMLRCFAGLMVLIGCAFVGILATNAMIVMRVFVWQWLTVLLPMLYLGAMETGFAIAIVKNDGHGWHVALTAVKRTFMYAAAGFLGSAVYLGVLARAASKALDPGVEGQSELIVDDEDSEYEIEA